MRGNYPEGQLYPGGKGPERLLSAIPRKLPVGQDLSTQDHVRVKF